MKQRKRLFLLLSLLFLIICIPFQANGASLLDVEGHWAEQNMIRGLELQWIQGYEDGSLKPDGIISRAEYITLLNRTLDLKEDMDLSHSQYNDIAYLSWAENTLRQAEKSGYLNIAFPDNILAPGQTINREEAAVLLDHVMALRATLNNGVEQGEAIELVKTTMTNKSQGISDPEVLSFSDRYQIQTNFLSSVRDLSNQGIITGFEDNHFRGKEELTRAQAMSLLLRALGEEAKTIEVSSVQVVEKEGKFYLQNPQNGELYLRSQFKGGIVNAADNTYLMDVDGSLVNGFYESGNKTYYADGQNGLTRGWKQIGDKLYYFSPMDKRMYKNGIFSTGDGAHWFDKDGAVREGKRGGGHSGKKIYWKYPSKEELTNSWLEGEDQSLRFRGQEIANFAASYEGLPFNWFGTDLRNPAGVYCCGTTYSAYKEFGIHIPGPNDVDMRKHKGYEMVRAQHQDAEKFGGFEVPADFSQLWPGDLVFNHSPRFYLGFNHVGIFMGHNGNTPIYIHATLKNGLIAEDTNQMNIDSKRVYNKTFIRYNTAANVGNGLIPEK